MTENDKCVLVLDEALPTGVLANAAAVLANALGKHRPEMVGRDLRDRDGHLRPGITTVAMPVLKGNPALLQQMRQKAKQFEPVLLVVEVISATRTTRSYEEYSSVLETAAPDDLEYLGLGFLGDKKTVAKLTGSLGLLK